MSSEKTSGNRDEEIVESSGQGMYDERFAYQPISPDEEGGPPKPKGIKAFTPFLIPLLIAIVVCWAMMTFMGVSSNTYRADITRLETDLVNIRTDIGNLNYVTPSELTTAISSVNTPDLSEYVKGANIGSYLDGYVTDDELQAVAGGNGGDGLVSLQSVYGGGDFTLTVNNQTGGTVYFYITGAIFHDSGESPDIAGFTRVSGNATGDRVTWFILDAPVELASEGGPRNFGIIDAPSGEWYYTFELKTLKTGEGVITTW